MDLSILPDTAEVIVELNYLLQKLTEAEDNKDVETQKIINIALCRFNSIPPSNSKFFDPIMSVKDAKIVFFELVV